MFEIKIISYLTNENEYIKILIIDPKPTGNIIPITKQITQSKLSPFQSNTKCYSNCLYAIMDFQDKTKFLCISKIAELYNYLISNGYIINEPFTTLMKNTNIYTNSQLLFYFN